MVKRRVWRHHRGSQNLYIEDEQTTQWSKEEFEDTKGVVRIRISKTKRQHNGEDTKGEEVSKTPNNGVVEESRIFISKTNRQHNGQKKSLKTPKGESESVEDEETTQWSKEEFEDTTGVVRIRISKTKRQHNGEKKSLKTLTG